MPKTELFEVFIDRTTGRVMYRIRAVSWPQSPLAWLGQPVVRHLQARFRHDSASVMREATRAARVNGRKRAGEAFAEGEGNSPGAAIGSPHAL